MFDKIFEKCSEKYGALIINNRKTGDSLTEKIFWYEVNMNDQENNSVDTNLSKEINVEREISLPNEMDNLYKHDINLQLNEIKNILNDIQYKYDTLINENLRLNLIISQTI